MEEEASFTIPYEDGELECTPDNTALFTFIGKLASRNHFFVALPEEPQTPGNILGVYFFQEMDAEGFASIAKFMIESGYPAHINMQQVPQCDEDMYQDFFNKLIARETEDVGDFLPDEW